MEANLNEMLNADIPQVPFGDIEPDTDEMTVDVEETTPIVDPFIAEQVEAEVEEIIAATTPEVIIDWISMYEYVRANVDKLVDVELVNTGGMSRIPVGKYILFYTLSIDDASLILFDKPQSYWVDSADIPTSIKVEKSGIIIQCENCTYYIGKTSTTKVNKVVGGMITSIDTVGRSNTSGNIKIATMNTPSTVVEVDTIKLYSKRISPRLYNIIKDMSDAPTIRTAIETFMSTLVDLNHLIKLEKDLFCALNF
jgi:hypothetical protein